MNQGKYVFSQVMEFVPHYQFDQCVEKYQGHHYVKNFTCREQFLSMAFGQLAYLDSLRSVVICLTAQRAKLYQLCPIFPERSRRLVTAADAKSCGYGGVSFISRVSGMARSTIGRGITELDEETNIPPERKRRTGGGGKKTTETARMLKK